MATGDHCGGQRYTRGEMALDNLPYAAMLAIGAATVHVALPPAAAGWEWAAAAAYVAYGLMSSLWIILFVCPFCPSYGSGTCPCGYGGIAARLRRKRDGALFPRKFKRNIPVLFPLWLAPPGLAGWGLWREFSWTLVALLAGFSLVAFVVLPLYARHGCERCPQREACPWMKAGDGAAAASGEGSPSTGAGSVGAPDERGAARAGRG